MRIYFTPHGTIFTICTLLFALTLAYEIGWDRGARVTTQRLATTRLESRNPATAPPSNCTFRGTVNDPITHRPVDVFRCVPPVGGKPCQKHL